MALPKMPKIFIVVFFPVVAVASVLFFCFQIFSLVARNRRGGGLPSHRRAGGYVRVREAGGEEALVRFPGGEALTVTAILQAPREVVAKSAHSTLFRAELSAGEAIALLRIVAPACAVGAMEAVAAARVLGAVRHANLVPIRAFYVSPRGEKLLVHPFHAARSLRRFLQGLCSSTWKIICKLSIGIAKGLYHLHTASQIPIIHGNLKTNNIMLDADFQPRISDFGHYLLLNPAAAKEMLETSAVQGYKAPELIKMRDVTRESDVYSLGVIMLKMLAQKVVQNSEKEENLKAYNELATACCNPSPSSRPDTKEILKRLEDIQDNS
ncbi:hypothetical protein EJB05_49556, partial [Eragrostis curvula]